MLQSAQIVGPEACRDHVVRSLEEDEGDLDGLDTSPERGQRIDEALEAVLAGHDLAGRRPFEPVRLVVDDERLAASLQKRSKRPCRSTSSCSKANGSSPLTPEAHPAGRQAETLPGGDEGRDPIGVLRGRPG